jgi:hypothetical protein
VIFTNDRTALDGANCFGDPRNVILLLRGAETDSPAVRVHSLFNAHVGSFDPHHRVAVIGDPFPFRDDEKQMWFDGNEVDHYAVLRVRPGAETRTRVANGRITTELFVNNVPDLFALLDALQIR